MPATNPKAATTRWLYFLSISAKKESRRTGMARRQT
jgi:hypothetical protein